MTEYNLEGTCIAMKKVGISGHPSGSDLSHVFSENPIQNGVFSQCGQRRTDSRQKWGMHSEETLPESNQFDDRRSMWRNRRISGSGPDNRAPWLRVGRLVLRDRISQLSGPLGDSPVSGRGLNPDC
jgi:hypothetical protein